MTTFQQIKYTLITLKSVLVGRSVITFCGSTYVVAGNYVRKL